MRTTARDHFTGALVIILRPVKLHPRIITIIPAITQFAYGTLTVAAVPCSATVFTFQEVIAVTLNFLPMKIMAS